jgi:hypothetical protein
MKNGLEEPKPIFADRSDLLFHHFENCNVTTMRWHCGRNVTEIVNFPDGKGKQLDAQGYLGGRSRQNAVRIAVGALPLSWGTESV